MLLIDIVLFVSCEMNSNFKRRYSATENNAPLLRSIGSIEKITILLENQSPVNLFQTFIHRRDRLAPLKK